MGSKPCKGNREGNTQPQTQKSSDQIDSENEALKLTNQVEQHLEDDDRVMSVKLKMKLRYLKLPIGMSKRQCAKLLKKEDLKFVTDLPDNHAKFHQKKEDDNKKESKFLLNDSTSENCENEQMEEVTANKDNLKLFKSSLKEEENEPNENKSNLYINLLGFSTFKEAIQWPQLQKESAVHSSQETIESLVEEYVKEVQEFLDEDKQSETQENLPVSMEQPKEEEEQKIWANKPEIGKILQCPRCKKLSLFITDAQQEENDKQILTAHYCKHCQYPLSSETAKKFTVVKKEIRQTFESVILLPLKKLLRQ